MEANMRGGIISAWQLPHPPIAVPEVGRGREREIYETVKMFGEASRKIAACGADTLIVISPHAPSSRVRGEALLRADARMPGDLRQFGATGFSVEYEGDRELAMAIEAEAASAGLRCKLRPDDGVANEGGSDAGDGGDAAHAGGAHDDASPRGLSEGLDHGVVVPLRFLENERRAPGARRLRLVTASVPDVPDAERSELLMLGACIERAASACGRRCALIASGDLSHRLRADGPYGFDPAGPEFDRRVLECIRNNDVGGLIRIDAGLTARAAQCGYGGLLMLYGAVEERRSAMRLAESISDDVSGAVSGGGEACDAACDAACGMGAGLASRVYSYEDAFGVGYAIAEIMPSCAPEGLGAASADVTAAPLPVDPYVVLAEESVRAYVTRGETLGLSEALRLVFCSDPEAPHVPFGDGLDALNAVFGGCPEAARRDLGALATERAGAFVSIKKEGELRGCIGTVAATRSCIAEEIVANAISACSRDPRFDPVDGSELERLSISVDILSSAEPVASLEELDHRRFGVIVSSGYRRGLLLPNLEGVDSVSEQLRIALAKAGIRETEPYSVERFEVVRHER